MSATCTHLDQIHASLPRAQGHEDCLPIGGS